MASDDRSKQRAKRAVNLLLYGIPGLLALGLLFLFVNWLAQSIGGAMGINANTFLLPEAQVVPAEPVDTFEDLLGCEQGRANGPYVENCLDQRQVYVFQRQGDNFVLFVDVTGGLNLGNPSYVELGCAERTRITGGSWIDAERSARFEENGAFLAKLLTREAGENTWRWVGTYPTLSAARGAYCG